MRGKKTGKGRGVISPPLQTHTYTPLYLNVLKVAPPFRDTTKYTVARVSRAS